MSRTQQLTVAKIEEIEVNELRTFLQDVGEKVKEFDHYEEGCDDLPLLLQALVSGSAV